MKQLDGGITAPAGFTAAGVFCGIKKRKKDLALLVSDRPAAAAGAFTRNIVQAAPVKWDQNIIEAGDPVLAVVINSGNANACTGPQGTADAESMAAETAEALQLGRDQANRILVCSTGVIGVPMPMDRVREGIRSAAAHLGTGRSCAEAAARAILTTDTFTKECAVEVELSGVPVRIAGIAKGSGMIHPNMATMLSFVLTDAAVDRQLLQELLHESVEESYNMVSVDGDTSTNDTVLVLANGASSAPKLARNTEDYRIFSEAFRFVNAALAKAVVRDGEGATKFIEVAVSGAATTEDARKLAKSVVTSSLVKAAFFGEDANWGRILCAMGYSGGYFDPDTADLYVSSPGGTVLLLQAGAPVPFSEDDALQVLKEHDIIVKVQLRDGSSSARSWGCDLSHEYVTINGSYRT